MRLRHLLCLFTIALGGRTLPASGQFVSVEPDNYPAGTVLNQIVPQVSLITAGTNNLPIPPISFDITATEDSQHFTSTGDRVFGHVGIPYMNDIRRLRMDFSGLVTSINLDFIGSGFTLLPERGHLEAYDLQDTLVAAFVTDIPGAGNVAPMAIQRPTADIAWAVAWSEGLTYGRLDSLTFTPVPEPSLGLLLAASFVALSAGGWFKRPRDDGG